MGINGAGNGYDGYSMSNNAVAAYEAGEKPISKWTKAEILAAAREIRPEAAEMLKSVNVNTLKANVLYKSSWHHTSSMYNRTDFYSVDEDKIETLTQDEVAGWGAVQPVKDTITYRGNIEYIEWSGTRNHPKANRHSLENVVIEEHNSFYIARDENGNEILRKKIGSNGTYVVNLDRQREAAEQMRQIEKAIEDNSSPEAYELYIEYWRHGERSVTGNLYARGRKPSPCDFENGVENFFRVGEKRLTPMTDGVDGYIVETWDGGKWIAEERKN